MYSDKFQAFIDCWRQDFGIEKSIDDKLCADAAGNPLPWYTYPAIEYLSQFDYREKKVFEYGCGFSSSFWAVRAAKVTSVEDNPEWFARWQKEFGSLGLDMRLRAEDESYENTIFEDGLTYDVIIIDGKRRAPCAEAAVRALADGGMVILDDSDRINASVEYVEAVRTLRAKGLLQVDFYGFCPMNAYSKTTSLFLSRNFDFKTLGKVQPANGWGNLWSKPRKERKAYYKKTTL